MHSYDGLPLYAVPLLRAAFTSQGIDPKSITDAGDIDGGLLAVSLMDTVTIRTNITPDMTINVRDTVTGPPSLLANALQPTLILRGGAAGNRTIAPNGEASGGDIIFAGLALFLGAVLVRLIKRKRAPAN